MPGARTPRGDLDHIFLLLDSVVQWGVEECCGENGLVEQVATVIFGPIGMHEHREWPEGDPGASAAHHRIFELLRDTEDPDDPGLIHTVADIMRDAAGYRFRGDAEDA